MYNQIYYFLNKYKNFTLVRIINEGEIFGELSYRVLNI